MLMPPGVRKSPSGTHNAGVTGSNPVPAIGSEVVVAGVGAVSWGDEVVSGGSDTAPHIATQWVKFACLALVVWFAYEVGHVEGRHTLPMALEPRCVTVTAYVPVAGYRLAARRPVTACADSTGAS